MQKDFWGWNTKKQKIHHEPKPRVFFHEREIWFCHLGVNVGYEQDGKGKAFGRPVIVFRKFNKEVFWGVPLTTRERAGKFYLPVDLGDGTERKAILSPTTAYGCQTPLSEDRSNRQGDRGQAHGCSNWVVQRGIAELISEAAFPPPRGRSRLYAHNTHIIAEAQMNAVNCPLPNRAVCDQVLTR